MAERAEREADIVAARAEARLAELARLVCCALSLLAAFSAGFEGGEGVQYVAHGKEEKINDSYKATTLLLQKIIAGKLVSWNQSGKHGLNCITCYRQNYVGRHLVTWSG